ncbi:TetR/AcrR family transcriptional regulator [Sphingomonas sp.]|uniref:TetR/AcrR family transcriptional regulator n=1 Tax=Sphingomonas sp. TaxID=28214 RepID=UPI002D80271E|nr:TetR/AcrR family transcriptional regulator [Sphingomonas sp.]HEU0045407.1 TetR/AcrR family transcriptional regulator [Sphingomonas sp.]
MSERIPSPRPAKPGRRAQNKADKLRRITDAAHRLFVEKGFDGTTMRDIATGAGVGFGTLFDYAANKRDLLFLTFNPKLESVLDAGLRAVNMETNVVDRLMALFSGYYALYGRERDMSRAVLRELNFFSEGAEAQKFLGHRDLFIAAVQEQFAHGIETGELRAIPVDVAGRAVFALYAWEVRRWLAADHPSLARGLLDLRTLLDTVIEGFRSPG